MKKVADIMEKKVWTVTKDEKISHIKRIMMINNIKEMIVVKDKKIEGIITNTDLLRDLGADTLVSELMIADVITVKKEDTLKECAKILTDHGVSAVPVIDENDDLVGIINQTMLVKNNFDVDEHQPELSPERLAIYLAMTDDRYKEKTWLDKCDEVGFNAAITQVGVSAEKLALKLREASIVASIARGVIEENIREKMAVSNAVRDIYSQLHMINPGLGGGFKVAIVRGNGRITVAVFGRCGHALANSPKTIAIGYSII